MGPGRGVRAPTLLPQTRSSMAMALNLSTFSAPLSQWPGPSSPTYLRPRHQERVPSTLRPSYIDLFLIFFPVRSRDCAVLASLAERVDTDDLT